MTLAEAFRLALDRSERVQLARTKVEEAAIVRGGTWDSYTPTIGMTTTANVQRERITMTGAVLQPGEQVTWLARMQQPLFRFDFSAARAAAKLGEQSAAAAVAYERDQLARDVARVFVDVLRTRKLIELARASVERATKQQEHAAARVKAGSVLVNATLLASIDLKRAQRQLAIAERDGGLAEGEFRRLVGRAPPPTLVLPAAAVPPKDILTVAAKRSDLRALQLRLYQARAEEDAARARRGWPRVDLVGDVFRTEPAVLGFTYDWHVFGLVTIPLLQGGREYTDIALQRNRTRAARLVLEERLEIVREDVEAAQLELSSADAVAALAEQQLTAALDHYNLVDKQFRLGAVTFLEVTNAQAVLVEAENTLALAKMEQLRALFDFQFAIGALDLDQPGKPTP
jgi:outer membrane protein TolC